jgi:hypothetical protein
MVENLNKVISKDELAVGTLIDSDFLEYSYVLHLNGQIRNRKSDELLSEVNSQNSESIGALLIARKPNGGRLRMTRSGIIAAYFEDHWGYLATVSPDQWFPEHLHLTV